MRLTGMGWYVAFCVVIGIVGGWWLDGLAGTKALFLLLGTVLGTVAAFWGMYKMVQPLLYGAQKGNTAAKRRKR